MTPPAALFYPRVRRPAGLALALALNIAFLAAFVAQTSSRNPSVPEPARMALIWAVTPVPAPPVPPAIAAPVRPRRAQRPPAAPVAPALPPTESAPVVPLDPFAEPAVAAPSGLDPRAVRAAIKATLAEARALEDTQKFVKSPRKANKYEQFAAEFAYAKVPYCLGQDALKFNPAEVKVGDVTIGLGGVLALPFYVTTVAKGKCRIK